MSTPGKTPGKNLSRNRYLVSSQDPATLASVLDNIRADPALQLLDTIGPSYAPHTAVVQMSAEQAQQLRQRFASAMNLSIEPDQPLSPFDGLG